MKDKKHTHPAPEAAPTNAAGVVRALPPPSIPPEQPNPKPQAHPDSVEWVQERGSAIYAGTEAAPAATEGPGDKQPNAHLYENVEWVRERGSAIYAGPEIPAAAPDSLDCARLQPVPERDKRQPPGVGLKRIDEFIRRYPGRKPDPDAIRREYVKSVTAETEDACHACLDRYIASDQVFREIVMNGDRWLRQQARNNWEGDWTRAQTKRSRLEERAADYARRREAEEKAHGD